MTRRFSARRCWHYDAAKFPGWLQGIVASAADIRETLESSETVNVAPAVRPVLLEVREVFVAARTDAREEAVVLDSSLVILDAFFEKPPADKRAEPAI